MFSFTRLRGADPKLSVEMASTGEVACFVIEPGAEEAVSSAGAPEGTASGASSRLSNITTVKRATHVATKTNIRFLIMAGESG